jgi:hypothetical protein
MSTSYRIQPGVHVCDLLEGRLEQFGIKEHVCSDTTENDRCLTNGACFLWLYIDDSYVRSLTRYFPNHPDVSNAIRNRPLCVMKNCPHPRVHDLG